MAITDSIGDYLTCLRNAVRAKKESVTIPSSKLKVRLTELLKQEKYISDFSIVEEGSRKYIHIRLRYLKGNKPAIVDLQRVSKPGLHIFSEAKKVPRIRSGLGTLVVSTSKGLMTDREARKSNVGGELLCKVW